MRYSDWQLNRLRDALRAYRAYGRTHEGEYFTWQDVAEAIDEDTGVQVPTERIRQFVEGVPTDSGGRQYPVPNDKRLKAIAQFATDEDNDLLSKDELKEYSPQYHAALRLLEYLDEGFDTERIVPPSTVQGRYQRRQQREDGIVLTELTLQRPLDKGMIQAVETEEFYINQTPQTFDELSWYDRREICSARKLYGGWGILTPEDSLYFFMKEQRNNRNHYYFSLASDFNISGDPALTRLVFLFQNFGLESDEQPANEAEVITDVIDTIKNNIAMFIRI